MPLPHKFVSGTIARSEEVNRNFNYVMDVIGQLSTPGSVKTTGELVLGPRFTGQLTAAHDTGGASTSFFQMSWNADWNLVGKTWKFERKVSNLGGTALRVGLQGFEVLTTKETKGDMHTQMKTILRVADESGGKYMYLPDDLHITNKNGNPTKLQEMRLTLVLLENPVAIYAGARVGKGLTIKSAYNYGIPKYAQAILVRAHVTAANGSGAGMHFYRVMEGGSTALNMYRGFVAHAPITGTGLGMRTGAQGVVPLGRGTKAGQFAIERTSEFELANVHIVGYYT